uniref:BEN domain-containing protein n=1 Tax=Panagrolaimus superbus TaxID=310955 RepID=A0A914XS43_9BILA
MAKTHIILQNPGGDFVIFSQEESNLQPNQIYELRKGNTIHYNDGLYEFYFAGTFDQCQAQIQYLHQQTPLKTPNIPNIPITVNTPKIYTSTPPSRTQNSAPFGSSSNISFNSARKRLKDIYEEEGDESETMTFKKSKFEDTVENLTNMVTDLGQKFNKLQQNYDELKEEHENLKQSFTSSKSPKSRSNRPNQYDIGHLTVLNKHGESVVISSLSSSELKELLIVKQPTLDATPTFPGLNHDHIVRTIGDTLLFELSKHSTKNFGFIISCYFFKQAAFLQTYFKPFIASTGNSRPKTKTMIADNAYKLIRYYSLFFGGCLFDDPHNEKLWLSSLQNSLNQKVDDLNCNLRKNKPVNFYVYDGHNPLFDENIYTDD